MREVILGLVEQHVTQPPAEDHPEHRVENEVVELLARDGGEPCLDAPHPEPPRRREAREVHEAVPAHGKRSDLDRDRVDIWMDQHGRIEFYRSEANHG